MRLCSVLGASAALATHLRRHPDQWRELTDPTLGSTRPAAYAVRGSLLRQSAPTRPTDAPAATKPDAEALDALRVEYRRILLRLASRDLAHHLGIDDAAAEISDLAAGTLEAALAVARARVGDSAALARLAVIAMGKCGGHELNYVSDVDVVFVFEPARSSRRSGRRFRRPARGDPAGLPPDAGLLRPHPRGHHLARRRQPAARGCVAVRWSAPWPATAATTRSGPRPGSSRRCSRRARSPATSRSGRPTSRPSSRWCGVPPSATASSPTSRRCVAASSTTSPPTRPSARSSSALAACVTWSSPSSCSSSCTAAPTPPCARARRSAPWPG